jgi:hypothetical protein
MAGLSDLITNTATKATSLPAWMSQAQQNVVNQASTAASQVPSLANTVAGQAINTYGGAQNPFAQATGTLQQIASGAANPWITSATGQVTPNTQTALGGLFQAQNQQLQQLAPNIMAPSTAAGTGAGQFGSLRTQTAADKALTDAQAQLFAQQMQAAQQAQQTGVQAGQAIGNIGAQDITGASTLTGLQQSAPFASSANLAKVIGGLSVPTSETQSVQLSPLNQIGALTSALGGGVGAANSLLGSISPGTSIGSLLGGLFSSNPSTGIMGAGITQPTTPVDVTQMPGYNPGSIDSGNYGVGTSGIE